MDEELSGVGRTSVSVVVQAHRGWVVLEPGPVGRTSATSLVFTGAASHEHPRYRSSRDSTNQVAIVCYVPTETLYVDCLMDHSLTEHADFARSLSASCFDASTGLPMRPVTRDDPAYLFDLEPPEPLGAAELLCDTTMPNMEAVVERAARRVGSSLERLVGVRFKTTYAMSPTDVVLSRALPET